MFKVKKISKHFFKKTKKRSKTEKKINKPKECLQATKIIDGPKILVACHPKSGSTYLSTSLHEVLNLKRSYLQESAEVQELSSERVSKALSGGFVGQSHVLPTKNTLKIIKNNNMSVVILQRSISDCLVSLRDMYYQKVLRQEGVWQGAFVSQLGIFGPAFCTLSNEEQMDYIINCAAPWYARFSAAWADPRIVSDIELIHVRYETLFADFESHFAELIHRMGLGDRRASDSSLPDTKVDAEKLRFNVGRSGRGAEVLSHRQWDCLKDVVSRNLPPKTVDIDEIL